MKMKIICAGLVQLSSDFKVFQQFIQLIYNVL